MRRIQTFGGPRSSRRDHGPAVVAQAVQAWLSTKGISTAFIEPGKPWQNGAVERGIGTCRDGCVNLEWSLSRRDARVIIARERQPDHEERPHSSRGDCTPAAVAQGRGVPPHRPLRRPTSALSTPRGLTSKLVQQMGASHQTNTT